LTICLGSASPPHCSSYFDPEARFLGQVKWGGSRQITDLDSGRYIKLIFFIFFLFPLGCLAQHRLSLKGIFALSALLQKRFFSLYWPEKVETNSERI